MFLVGSKSVWITLFVSQLCFRYFNLSSSHSSDAVSSYRGHSSHLNSNFVSLSIWYGHTNSNNYAHSDHQTSWSLCCLTSINLKVTDAEELLIIPRFIGGDDFAVPGYFLLVVLLFFNLKFNNTTLFLGCKDWRFEFFLILFILVLIMIWLFFLRFRRTFFLWFYFRVHFHRLRFFFYLWFFPFFFNNRSTSGMYNPSFFRFSMNSFSTGCIWFWLYNFCINDILNRMTFSKNSILLFPRNPINSGFPIRFISLGYFLLIPGSKSKSTHVMNFHSSIFVHSDWFEVDQDIMIWWNEELFTEAGLIDSYYLFGSIDSRIFKAVKFTTRLNNNSNIIIKSILLNLNHNIPSFSFSCLQITLQLVRNSHVIFAIPIHSFHGRQLHIPSMRLMHCLNSIYFNFKISWAFVSSAG